MVMIGTRVLSGTVFGPSRRGRGLRPTGRTCHSRAHGAIEENLCA